MAHGDTELRRVSVHAGPAHVDLALPATVPIATLLPAIVDRVRGVRPAVPAPYRLAPPGAAALDTGKTLAQQQIRDGAVLILSSGDDPPPRPPVDDVAEAVARAVHPRTAAPPPVCRALAATGFAAVAGFVAVPGGPGAPNVLLAAAAAATVSVLATRLSGAGTVLTTVAQVAALAAVAALLAVCGVRVQVVGAVLAAAGVGLLQVSARLAATAAGLPARVRGDVAADGVDAQAIRAHTMLASLVIAAAAAVALGSVGAAVGVQHTGVPRYGALVFAVAAAVLLALRARAYPDRPELLALLVAATVAAGAAVAVAVRQHPLGMGAAAGLVAVALGGVRVPRSPLAERAVELAEYAALIAVIPLACWICGVFDAVRTVNLL